LTALVLPSPFDMAEVGAHTEYGHREVTWHLREPGELHRNRYDMAWVEVHEQEPWRGEPLWLRASRRTAPGGWSRVPFTDAARASLHKLLVPLVARYGFSRLWMEHRNTRAAGELEHYRSAEDDALTEARWWNARRELAEMQSDGFVDAIPVRDEFGHRPTECRIYGDRSRHWERVAARAVVNGEQVGWFTVKGELVPSEARGQGS
jgi:hypothetical protein